MGKSKIVIPPAKSLIEGLRNMGYSFSTALADIVDNSISAGAKNVIIQRDPQAVSPYVVIFDDGCGMGRKTLENSMTIGSDRSDKIDSPEELGRFGLGLKTASFSQCLKLTVASKDCGRINAMQYDIDEIKGTNSWVLNELDENEIRKIPCIDLLMKEKSGTIVVWEKLDTIEDQSTPEKFDNSLAHALTEAHNHLSFVFHRFYDEVNISVDGHRLEKRDPFLKGFPKTQDCKPSSIPLNGSYIEIRPYVLPNSDSLTIEQKALLGHTSNVTKDQGFYIYRNRRLILWGTWLHMNERNELNKLARVQVDIPSSLDSIWKIDVKKSSAKIPDVIKADMRAAISEVIGSSKREVTYKGRKESTANLPLWDRHKRPDGTIKYEINKDHPLYSDVYGSLKPDQRDLFDTYLKKVEDYIPIDLITNDVNDSNVKVTRIESDPSLESDAKDLVDLVNKHYHGSVDVLNSLLESQGFEHLKDLRDEMVEQLYDETRD